MVKGKMGLGKVMRQRVALLVGVFVVKRGGEGRGGGGGVVGVGGGGGGRLMKVFAENTTKIRIWNDNET